MPKEQNLWLSAVVLSILLAASNTVLAECAQDIKGKWQQSHVEFAGNRIADDSQSWEFMANGTVRFMKSRPEIDTTADYSCEGDIIYMKGKIPGCLKIVAFDRDTMAWESLDHGGGITHVIRVK